MLPYADIWALVHRWGIEMRVTRLRNLTLLVDSILRSRSGCLMIIVRHWSFGPARHVYRLKRLHRFLKNPAMKVEPIFRPLAAIVWPYRPGGQRTSLVPIAIDLAKLRSFNLLWAAVPRKKNRPCRWLFGVYHA